MDTALDSRYPVSLFRGDPKGSFVLGVANHGTIAGPTCGGDLTVPHGIPVAWWVHDSAPTP